MSNVLTPPELHDKNSRSGFDLSNKVLFTSKFGEILPVKYWECLPGDKFKIKLNSFIRTADMSSVNFTRMRQYYNFYFVPYRLLWRDFPSFVVNRPDTAKQATAINSPRQISSILPYIASSDITSIFSHTTPSIVELNNKPTGINANPRLIPDNSYPWFELDSTNRPTIVYSKYFNPFGFLRTLGTFKLLQHLGYNSLIPYNELKNQSFPEAVNALPILAYHKIYQDYFRNSQWEKENPSTYNVDYLSSDSPQIPLSQIISPSSSIGFQTSETTLLDLNYANYNKDLFNGVLPSSQFGAVGTVKAPLSSTTIAEEIVLGLRPEHQTDISQLPDGQIPIVSQKSALIPHYHQNSLYFVGKDNLAHKLLADLGGTISSPNGERYQIGLNELLRNSSAAFTVLQLRIAEAQQRFAEISATNDANYKSQIEAHFGVKVSSLMSSLCDYLGGIGLDINQNVVQNTNLADSSAVNLGSYGTAGGDKFIEYEVKEHGIIMCVSYAVPQLEYLPVGNNPLVTKLEYTDFALPEFDNLGLEEVPIDLLRLPDNDPEDQKLTPLGGSSLGYTTRYYEYKTDIDVVLGDFHTSDAREALTSGNSFNGTLSDWSLRLTPNNYPALYSVAWGRDIVKYNLGDLGSYKIASRFIPDFPKYWLFKINPHVVDSIFIPQAGQTVKSDVLRHAVFFDTKVVRNLSRSGLPY